MSGQKEFFCTDIAWEKGVPLVGTATRGDVWFLIEYAGRWGSNAFEESTIPDDVKNYLLGLVCPGLTVRILLIKQTDSRTREGFTFFVGQTFPEKPRLYEYHFKSYLEILDLDLSLLGTRKLGDASRLRKEPLFLVCTNGVRDKCCAVYGPKVFHEM